MGASGGWRGGLGSWFLTWVNLGYFSLMKIQTQTLTQTLRRAWRSPLAGDVCVSLGFLRTSARSPAVWCVTVPCRSRELRGLRVTSFPVFRTRSRLVSEQMARPIP